MASYETAELASWRSPLVERREGGLHGIGLFAIKPISQGELIAVKAGKIVTLDFVIAHPHIMRGTHMQLTDDLFLGPTTTEEWDETLIGFNHSCEPNLYIDGDIKVKTMKDVEVGEELTCDFSTAVATSTHSIQRCLCGTSSCRGKIDPANDWKDSSFQRRYKGHFSNYVKSLIDSNEMSI